MECTLTRRGLYTILQFGPTMVVDAPSAAITVQRMVVVGHQLGVLGQLNIDLHSVQPLFQSAEESLFTVHRVGRLGPQATMADQMDPAGIRFSACCDQACQRYPIPPTSRVLLQCPKPEA
jgi:hypothetical protein